MHATCVPLPGSSSDIVAHAANPNAAFVLLQDVHRLGVWLCGSKIRHSRSRPLLSSEWQQIQPSSAGGAWYSGGVPPLLEHHTALWCGPSTRAELALTAISTSIESAGASRLYGCGRAGPTNFAAVIHAATEAAKRCQAGQRYECLLILTDGVQLASFDALVAFSVQRTLVYAKRD